MNLSTAEISAQTASSPLENSNPSKYFRTAAIASLATAAISGLLPSGISPRFG